MKRCILSFSLFLSLTAFAREELRVENFANASQTPFIRYPDVLVLNVPYAPIVKLREELNRINNLNLDFLRSLDPNGEAHVTTITPPEYLVLKDFVNIDEINQIAEESNIQEADISILGIGSAKQNRNGRDYETFFVLVESRKLRDIRYQIWKKFVADGGRADAFDPDLFFPHITVGYINGDVHYPVAIKDVRGSLDKRFKLIITE